MSKWDYGAVVVVAYSTLGTLAVVVASEAHILVFPAGCPAEG